MTTGTHDRRDQVSEIEHAVLSYLDRHPLAADTLDGITRWWLPEQRYVTAEARIEQVLQQLVSDGVLQIKRLPNGGALYALSVDHPLRIKQSIREDG